MATLATQWLPHGYLIAVNWLLWLHCSGKSDTVATCWIPYSGKLATIQWYIGFHLAVHGYVCGKVATLSGIWLLFGVNVLPFLATVVTLTTHFGVSQDARFLCISD